MVIVEVVWKVCAMVVNFRLKRSVTLHDALYGFRVGGEAWGRKPWKKSWRSS